VRGVFIVKAWLAILFYVVVNIIFVVAILYVIKKLLKMRNNG